MANISSKRELDTKLLSLLEEQLNEEALLYKKYLNLAGSFLDCELKNICHEASKKHRDNYHLLLSYLI
ncbi:hypothetical protein [Dethiothermospora halolimnae]|uniref:hypothetical protein n=1 Tax=Dethiothermospora halolimnae TaxID=3114390 RepID=UPI003CCBD7B1